jgi:hypothetical protein
VAYKICQGLEIYIEKAKLTNRLPCMWRSRFSNRLVQVDVSSWNGGLTGYPRDGGGRCAMTQVKVSILDAGTVLEEGEAIGMVMRGVTSQRQARIRARVLVTVRDLPGNVVEMIWANPQVAAPLKRLSPQLVASVYLGKHQ